MLYLKLIIHILLQYSMITRIFYTAHQAWLYRKQLHGVQKESKNSTPMDLNVALLQQQGYQTIVFDFDGIFGNTMLLIAAMSWAFAMLHIRFATWHSSPLTLIPWQLLIGLIFVTTLALIFEPNPTITWNMHLFGSILYTGVFSTAFGYWGVVELSKNMPAIKMSLCLLAVPVAGLLASALILHEPLTGTIMTAMLFILMGLATLSLRG